MVWPTLYGDEDSDRLPEPWISRYVNGCVCYDSEKDMYGCIYCDSEDDSWRVASARWKTRRYIQRRDSGSLVISDQEIERMNDDIVALDSMEQFNEQIEEMRAENLDKYYSDCFPYGKVRLDPQLDRLWLCGDLDHPIDDLSDSADTDMYTLSAKARLLADLDQLRAQGETAKLSSHYFSGPSHRNIALCFCMALKKPRPVNRLAASVRADKAKRQARMVQAELLMRSPAVRPHNFSEGNDHDEADNVSELEGYYPDDDSDASSCSGSRSNSISRLSPSEEFHYDNKSCVSNEIAPSVQFNDQIRAMDSCNNEPMDYLVSSIRAIEDPDDKSAESGGDSESSIGQLILSILWLIWRFLV